MGEVPTFVTHLECSLTGERYEADRVHNLSRAGKPLLVRYDLEALGRAVDKETLARRAPELWRYREFLPIRRSENVVRLGEVMTPLIDLPRIASRLSAREILVKDEGRLPTGSFKARGLALAVSMAKELGITPAWPCPPTAMPGPRSPPIAAAPVSRPSSSAQTTRRRST